MMWYSLQEWLLIIIAAILIDWVIGDPKWPTHPVIWMGRWIKWLQGKLYHSERNYSTRSLLYRGLILTVSTVVLVGIIMVSIHLLTYAIHPWLSYIVSAWLLSTTIAVKGLKDAGNLVHDPLISGDMDSARRYVGYIVSRDSEVMDESDMTRATVETIAENIVDAFVSPIFWALIGGAPLAMVYRACNTLDSMVGYRNEKFEYFGKCSARLDDILNYIPARLTGLIIVTIAWLHPKLDGRKCYQSIITFAKKHPSPNSGIPESAVAGALHIELGGRNRYFGQWHERARLGWPSQPLQAIHIKMSINVLYGVRIWILIGVIAVWLMMSVNK
ncbi:adenosylcobinamide-phosphate synthase CbiB [Paenibacillus endoradicis]|uniref:adenosylcobinamide-phosphate synthase CbiB n=1 Tax=Paenibacillus endoradicis TaxID=2972487 RepID=UPI0021595B7F|nr:adenosylcobinamide-phosphate synthase CbiB [Paenibacillus endoradicis]MCR8656375.1 adenosylcobinamide-phosphate synthase CbiB [Paenibacillus endoradicis]